MMDFDDTPYSWIGGVLLLFLPVILFSSVILPLIFQAILLLWLIYDCTRDQRRRRPRPTGSEKFLAVLFFYFPYTVVASMIASISIEAPGNEGMQYARFIWEMNCVLTFLNFFFQIAWVFKED